MIKAVLFDFYGVFTPDVYDTWLKENNLIREGIYAHLSEDLDAGTISHSDFYSSLSQQSKVPLHSIEKSFASPKEIDPLLIKIIKSLYLKNISIGLLSNGSSNVRTLIEKAGITYLFDDITLSSEIGIIKPNPAIFNHGFTQLSVEPEEVLYVDDRIANTLIAKSLGSSVIHFVSTDLLEKELKAHNIL